MELSITATRNGHDIELRDNAGIKIQSIKESEIGLWFYWSTRMEQAGEEQQPDEAHCDIGGVMPCYLTASMYHQEGNDIILRQDSEYKVIAKYRDMYCIVDEINELSVFNADYFNKA